MNTKRNTIASVIAISTLLATAGAALAASAVATTAVNVRSGPGTGYAIRDSLYTGEQVDVEGCNGSWCKIQHVGPDGWVSKTYLAASGRGGGRSGGGNSASDIPFNFGVTVGPGGPSISFGFGDAPAPVPVHVAPKVCFYKNAGFTGSRFCVPAGHHTNHLPRHWNDKISSIRLIGDAKVEVCKTFWNAGHCATLHDSKSHLRGFNNTISSFRSW